MRKRRNRFLTLRTLYGGFRDCCATLLTLLLKRKSPCYRMFRHVRLSRASSCFRLRQKYVIADTVHGWLGITRNYFSGMGNIAHPVLIKTFIVKTSDKPFMYVLCRLQKRYFHKEIKPGYPAQNREKDPLMVPVQH